MLNEKMLNKIKKYCNCDVQVLKPTTEEPILFFISEDIVIHNPFWNDNYTEEVDPIQYYGEKFLNSDFCKEGAIEKALKEGYIALNIDYIGDCFECSTIINEDNIPWFSMNYACADGTTYSEENLISSSDIETYIANAILDDAIVSFRFGEYCPECGAYLG